MTAYINKLKDKSGNQQLMVTHERAVRDDNGTTLESKMQNLEGAMDKAYVAQSHNGMGRITLPKNNGVLTPSMMQATNTIYIIRYDFVLGGDITMPANCVLEFDGGSISASGNNDTITLNNTLFDGKVKFISSIKLTGICGNNTVYTNWFDIDTTGATLVTSTIQQLFNIKVGHIVFNKGTYAFNKITVNDDCVIEGEEGCRPVLVGQPQEAGTRGCDSLFYSDDIKSVTIRNFEVTANIGALPSTGHYNLGLFWFKDLDNVVVDDVFFNEVILSKVDGTHIYPVDPTIACFDNIKHSCVKNCEFYHISGGEQVFVYVADRENSTCVFDFDNNYVHHITDGNSIVTALADVIHCRNNRVDDWKADMSIFNLFGNKVYIDGNIVTDSETSSAFDMSEYGGEKNVEVVASNNHVECKNAIVFVTSSDNVNIINNNVKALCLMCNIPTNRGVNSLISVSDNIVDATYFDTVKHNPYSSAICIDMPDTNNPNTSIVNITNNSILYNKANSDTLESEWKIRTAIKVGYSSEDILDVSENEISGHLMEYYSCSLPIIFLCLVPDADITVFNTTINVGHNNMKNLDEKIVCLGFLSQASHKAYIDRLIVNDNYPSNLFMQVYVRETINGGNYTNLRGFPLFSVIGHVSQAHVANISSEQFAYINNDILFNKSNRSSSVAEYNNTDDAGTTINPGTVVNVDNYGVQLLSGSATLGSQLATDLASLLSSDFGTIMKIGNNLWRKCPDDKKSIVNVSKRLKNTSGTTRPTLTNAEIGFMFFDTSISPQRPIYYKGNGNWVDATGTPV